MKINANIGRWHIAIEHEPRVDPRSVPRIPCPRTYAPAPGVAMQRCRFYEGHAGPHRSYELDPEYQWG